MRNASWTQNDVVRSCMITVCQRTLRDASYGGGRPYLVRRWSETGILVNPDWGYVVRTSLLWVGSNYVGLYVLRPSRYSPSFDRGGWFEGRRTSYVVRLCNKSNRHFLVCTDNLDSKTNPGFLGLRVHCVVVLWLRMIVRRLQCRRKVHGMLVCTGCLWTTLLILSNYIVS